MPIIRNTYYFGDTVYKTKALVLVSDKSHAPREDFVPRLSTYLALLIHPAIVCPCQSPPHPDAASTNGILITYCQLLQPARVINKQQLRKLYYVASYDNLTTYCQP